MKNSFKQDDPAELSKKFQKSIKAHFPDFFLKHNPTKNLLGTLSPFCIYLPKKVLADAATCIEKIFTFSRSHQQMERLLNSPTLTEKQRQILQLKTQQTSVLMCYDFHVQSDGSNLSLIEVNTNASGYLISNLVKDAWNIPIELELKNLVNSFADEARARGVSDALKIAIVDEALSTQKMLPEFFLYKELFMQQGWSADLVEASDLNVADWNFIYNRLTDFYFDSPITEKLYPSYIGQQKVCVSPNPKEYLLLADKNRLIDFHQFIPSPIILKTLALKSLGIEDAWAQRKNYFFKPANSFGAKGVYKGASISRKFFDRIYAENYLMQELSPPGTVGDWKFDLRFYVYNNVVQSYTARVYQGQVTGFNIAGSGFAPLIFETT